MSQSLSELLEVVASEATENTVRLLLRDRSGGQISALQGSIRGPRCARARTLAATFPLESDAEGGSLGVLITEPCYWTPALPYLYDVNLEVEFADGTTHEWKHPVGVKRFEIHGPHLFRERRRVVVRGAYVADPTIDVLAQAVDAELSLLVAEPSEEFLARASELGVSLLIDVQSRDDQVAARLASYSWHPAVDAVLFDHQSAMQDQGHSSALWGQRILVSSDGPIADWARLVVVELGVSERPHAWLSDCNRPVVAFRRVDAHADFFAARRSCDRLQSDLAPEFDLAGYFV